MANEVVGFFSLLSHFQQQGISRSEALAKISKLKRLGKFQSVQIDVVCNCGAEWKVDWTPDLPNNAKWIKVNWCPECEENADAYYDEEVMTTERKSPGKGENGASQYALF